MGRHAGNRGNNKGFRTTDETWETFLCHLTTMSAIEASKQPGMPSAPAFVKKRWRDPAFKERADVVIAARRLNNSGRKRITSNAWARFVEQLPFMSVNRLVEVEGMPSMAAVYSRRRKDADFRALLDGIIHDVRREKQRRIDSSVRFTALRHDPAFIKAMRTAPSRPAHRRQKRPVAAKVQKRPPLGEAMGAALLRDELFAAASAVVPPRLERHTRMDIISDLVLAVLEGEINISDLAKAAKEFTKRHWKMFGTIATVSLDAPVSPGSKATIGDRLCGEASSYWG